MSPRLSSYDKIVIEIFLTFLPHHSPFNTFFYINEMFKAFIKLQMLIHKFRELLSKRRVERNGFD